MKKNKFKNMLKTREAGMFFVMLIMIVIILLSGTSNRDIFSGATNIENLTRQIALLGLFAIGETIVIIAGGFDLSVGSLIALSGVIASILMSSPTTNGFDGPGWGFIPTILVTVFISILFGLLNGYLIAYCGLPPFVVTLGTMSFMRGIAKLLSEALTISIINDNFNALGNGKLSLFSGFEIPIPVLILLFFSVLVGLFMRYTIFGKYIYALGSNEIATKFSGIHVKRIKLLAFTLCGGLAGLGGIVFAGYTRLGDPGSGVGYELNAIAAAVIGGASLSGGEGSVAGTLIGTAILCIILNGLNIVVKRNASLWEGVIVGIVVITAVALNHFRQRRQA